MSNWPRVPLKSKSHFEFIWFFVQQAWNSWTQTGDRQVSTDDSWIYQIFGVQIHWIQVLYGAHFGVWVACGLIMILSGAEFSNILFINPTIYPFHGSICWNIGLLNSFMMVKLAEMSTLTKSSGKSYGKKQVDNFHVRLKMDGTYKLKKIQRAPYL